MKNPHRSSALNSDRPRSRNLSSLRYIFGYLPRYRFQIIMACIALIFTASGVLGLGAGLRYLVDEGLSKNNPHLLDMGFLILLGFTLLLSLSAFGRIYFVARIGESVIADIRRDIYNHVIRLSPAFFELTRTGEIISRLTTDTTLLQAIVGGTIAIALRNFLLLIGGTTLLLITSAKLTVYVFLILPLVVIPIIFLGKKVRILSRLSQDRVADVSNHIDETVMQVRTVQAFAREEGESQRFAGFVNDALGTALQRVKMRALLGSLVIAMVFSAIVGVLWMGGRDVIAGNITPGELSSFVFYAVVVAGAVGAISEIIGDLQRAAGSTERLIELFETEPHISIPANPVAINHATTPHIIFDAINFSYPTRPDSLALSNVSFTVEPGETIALVGPSGAGKTTIFQLLLRFYDPASGTITIGDNNIRDYDPQALRQYIGLVSQDPVIFSASAADNIRYGNPEASIEAITAAAEDAAAMEFIERLPDGFNTDLGERGVRLSGGQRQRIAIARALLKDPAILLLDEATSSLDAENEKLVQQALDRIMENRTTIVIAHRLSTVRHADRILVVDDGRICAVGTHETLLAENGLYARLATLQFRNG